MKQIFGPVASRRLGISLGVDLIPHKTCSFDCIYCELGRTTNKTVVRKEYVFYKLIMKEVEEWHCTSVPNPDYISLGGSGEPTLNTEIGRIIQGIKRLTPIPVAVLTNSSLLTLDSVRKELLEADVVLPSLDGVSPQIFGYLNRPHPSMEIEGVIQGLIDFRKEFKGGIWLEILFCRGINDDRAELQRIREAINRINPDKIHLNTVTRPPAEEFAFALSKEKLEGVKEIMGERAEIITDFDKTNLEAFHPDVESEVMNLLKRRPCTLDDISRALGVHKGELIKDMDKLRREGRIQYRIYNRRGYYQVKEGF